jgi:hypothetical protein
MTKAKIIGYFFIAMVLLSCKKDKNENPEEGKKYQVSLNVSGFTQTITDIKTTSTGGGLQTSAISPVADIANVLHYFVYNASNQLVGELHQTSATANFGTVTDTFSPGTYTVAILAGMGGPTDYSGQDRYFSTGGYDTYFKKTTITVTSGPVEQNVTLDRIVGQLQIKITDAIPVETKTISVQVSDYKHSMLTGDIQNDKPYSLYKTITVPDAAKGLPDFLITSYVSKFGTPLTVIITASNTAGANIARVTINNVMFSANTRTLLSGALFDSGTNGFTTSFNETWDSTPYATITF